MSQEKPVDNHDLNLGVMDDEDEDFLLGSGGEAPQACPLDPEGRDQCESCQ